MTRVNNRIDPPKNTLRNGKPLHTGDTGVPDVEASGNQVVEIIVPFQNRPLAPPSAERIRRLRRHLVESLRDLRATKRPDRLPPPRISDPGAALPVACQPYVAKAAILQPDIGKSGAGAPAAFVTAILQAGCGACQGHCCLGGGDHAWLDEPTMARVLQDHPRSTIRRLIQAYIQHVAPLGYAGSCLFHGPTGCTLATALRANLCANYYCDELTAVLAQPPDPASRVVIRACPPRPTPRFRAGRTACPTTAGD